MLRKRYLSLSLLTFSLLNFDVYASSETHTYVGAQLGYGSGAGQVKSDYSNVYFGPNALTGTSKTVEAKLGTAGVLGGLHAGAGSILEKSCYLGLELSADLANVQGSRTGLVNALRVDLTDSLRLKMTRSFGLALKTGLYLHKKTLAFVKLGVARSKWEMNARFFNDTASVSQYKMGFKPAVGMETNISKNVIIGGEFNYTYYSALKIDRAVPQLGMADAPTTHSARPKMAAFQVHLSYKM